MLDLSRFNTLFPVYELSFMAETLLQHARVCKIVLNLCATIFSKLYFEHWIALFITEFEFLLSFTLLQILLREIKLPGCRGMI